MHLIDFNISLAQKAWQQPDQNGVWYILQTRSKLPAKVINVDDDAPYPLRVLVRSLWDPNLFLNEAYGRDGHYLKLTPTHMDLQLFRCNAAEYGKLSNP